MKLLAAEFAERLGGGEPRIETVVARHRIFARSD